MLDKHHNYERNCLRTNIRALNAGHRLSLPVSNLKPPIHRFFFTFEQGS
jgi:hypothetical protein